MPLALYSGMPRYSSNHLSVASRPLRRLDSSEGRLVPTVFGKERLKQSPEEIMASLRRHLGEALSNPWIGLDQRATSFSQRILVFTDASEECYGAVFAQHDGSLDTVWCPCRCFYEHPVRRWVAMPLFYVTPE